MKRFLLLSFLFAVTTVANAQSLAQTSRPWTYWWWMGSAVNEADITRQLEQFAGAGLGGVHIIPIYGVRGYEKQFIPFLSDRWLAVFAHTVREANRVGLGVDLSAGTGWPFGGPNVTPDMAAKQWKVIDGKLTTELTKQQVKRAAPGGAGLVVDYFDKTAVRQYLTRFDSTLVRLPQKPRAVYNDSYEVYGANWSTTFADEFKKRRGYDLNSQLPAFLDTTGTETGIWVKQDFHQTLSDLLHDGFTDTWTGWAQSKGYKTRNQAHGSPGNLLDLYALTDIPETESFGSSRFPIPGLRVDKYYDVERFGTPHPLAMKFASSAANLTGKPLVSSETTTWLANHFHVSLSQIKPQIDELFTAGINHIFYHGTNYSPAAEAYPGWLFYASTHYGPTSHLWPHFPLLNQYIERCQSRLQRSRPDNDVLVYFPIHDLWSTPAKSAGGIHQLEVHHVERWLLPLPFGRLGEQLLQRGYSFDYVSDDLLAKLTVDKQGQLKSGSATYRVLLIPRCTYLPETTLAQIEKLAKQGVRVVFADQLPKQAAGFYQHQSRSLAMQQRGKELQKLRSVRVSQNVFQTLDSLGVRSEQLASSGLSFIRKQIADTTQYFITNLGDRFQEGWVTLSMIGNATQYDPLTNQIQQIEQRRTSAGKDEVFLHVKPGQSFFINVVKSARSVTKTAERSHDESVIAQLNGPWQFQFQKGRPALTLQQTMPMLTSWTTLSDSASYFSGQGHYVSTFDLPATLDITQTYTLDLGDVREVAEVRLNGQPLGTAWCILFQLTIPANRLRRGANRLEIDVTNLSANYMRLYDRQNPGWKKFYDINIVDIRYQPFDASKWEPMPSGLLGPIQIRRSF
ncbi:glycosyl hydrolase [Spirosoma validum]|uniref:Glycoside hydrolase n=1 Tax=Spirosoma validum TaxID=2771355 RepID=A0A927GH23_9BACT|nr:glycosyl hydrolase [Spirosoma validum]MBD2757298.1 glycoside hydrolase [Spirosoma validum]